MSNDSYPSPLDRRLTLGDAWKMEPWPDYLALGLGPEHIPDLIRMATDPELNEGDSDSGEVWAPGHAWRALAQLHAVEAAPPLALLFRRIDEDQEDFLAEGLPQAFGVLGPGAIPALTTYLADDAHGLWARVAAGHSLEQIGARHAEQREACAAVLACQLERFALQGLALNGSLVAYLVELKAVEAAPVIERAFRAGQVDEMVVGDWEDVQVAFGLKARREQPRQPPPPGTPAAALYQLSDGLKRQRPQPTPKSVVEARLARAVRETQLGGAAGPKRKHHRKRK